MSDSGRSATDDAGARPTQEPVRIQSGDATLEGDLTLPEGGAGLVLFAHGSGSSRFSTQDRFLAGELHRVGLGTLLVDLLTPDEAVFDARTHELRFDIPLLARRLVDTLSWLATGPRTRDRAKGIFGADTGAAAALIATAALPGAVQAVVSRGGRPDLAGNTLRIIQTPTLLLVGARDREVLALNERARGVMTAQSGLIVVPGANHHFPEPGALEQVAEAASAFFGRHLHAGELSAR